MSQWIEVGVIQDIPSQGARVVKTERGDIAVFRTHNNEVFALQDECPHKKGALSQGIIHGKRVTCPLHNWVIDLQSGVACGDDVGCTPAYAVKLEGDRVWLSLEAQA